MPRFYVTPTDVNNSASLNNIAASGYAQLGASNTFTVGGHIITAEAAGIVPFIFKGASSQTADLQQWQNSAGTVLSTFNASGQLIVGSATQITVSGSPATVSIYAASYNSGLVLRGSSQIGTFGPATFRFEDSAQNTLIRTSAYGDIIIGDGATPNRLFLGNGNDLGPLASQANFWSRSSTQIPLSLYGAAGQTADMLSLKTNSGSILSAINASGQLTIGSATPIVSTSAAMLSIYNSSSNTPGLIIRNAANQAVDPFILQNSTTGQVFGINDSGKIKIGLNAGFGSPLSMLSIQTNNTGATGAIIRGTSGQTANLQEWQNSSGSVVSAINASGQAIIGGSAAISYGSLASLSVYTGASTTPGIVIKGATSQSEALQRWLDSSGTSLADMSANGYLRVTRLYGNTGNGYIGSAGGNELIVFPHTSSNVVWTVRGNSGQSADLQQWQNSAGASAVAIDALGNITASGNVVYNQAITSVSSVFYTLLSTDSGKFVDMTSSVSNTIYIPASANVAWSIGARIDIIQSGAGQTNIVPANAAITVNYYSPTASAARTIKGRYGAATLVYKSAENWLLIGNLS
jgi:hypothetical protein